MSAVRVDLGEHNGNEKKTVTDIAKQFTPTTEQVRRGFAEDPVAEYYDPITNHTREGERVFDRWLREHDAQVKADAWDEGVLAGNRPMVEVNPYRKKVG